MDGEKSNDESQMSLKPIELNENEVKKVEECIESGKLLPTEENSATLPKENEQSCVVYSQNTTATTLSSSSSSKTTTTTIEEKQVERTLEESTIVIESTQPRDTQAELENKKNESSKDNKMTQEESEKVSHCLPASDSINKEKHTTINNAVVANETGVKQESKDDAKIEIDSNSLLDRVILYSLKNTVVDNSRLDAVKNRYLNISGSSSTLTSSINSNNNNNNNINSNNNNNSNKASDSNLQQSNSKSVSEVIEEFKSCSKLNNSDWSYNNSRLTSDKSDRHDEPSIIGAEKVYKNNDSNNSLKENVVRDNEVVRECEKNVILIPKGAETSYKRDFISESPHISQVKKSETENSYDFNNRSTTTTMLNFYDNNNYNRFSSMRDRMMSENSFLKREPIMQIQQPRHEEKSVIAQTRAPYMRLPDFSKQSINSSMTSTNKPQMHEQQHHSQSSYHHEIQQNQSQIKSETPQMRNLKFQNLNEVIRRNNYISDLQLKPPTDPTNKYNSYPHTPPPLHYSENYPSSSYHQHHHHHHLQQQQQQQQQLNTKNSNVHPTTRVSTVIAHMPREPSLAENSMPHVIHKNHPQHFMTMKGEATSQSQMRSNESGMKSMHHHMPPAPTQQHQPQQQNQVLNSHNQTVSVITARDPQHDRMRINYHNEVRNHPGDPHYNSHYNTHSFSLKQKEDQLRQEGTIITLKTELNIVSNYSERSSTEVIREYHQSKPHQESYDIRRTTYHISHQGYHGQDSKDKDHRTIHETNPSMLVPFHSSPMESYNSTTPTSSRSSNSHYNNPELQAYDRHNQHMNRVRPIVDEHNQLRPEFVSSPHPQSFAARFPHSSSQKPAQYQNIQQNENYSLTYPRHHPPVPIKSHPQPTNQHRSGFPQVNREVARTLPNVTDTSASTSTRKPVVKKESPLDLSVKTVKTKADSTGCDQDKLRFESPKSLKIEFNPDFSRVTQQPPPPPQNQPPFNLAMSSANSNFKSHENSYPNHHVAVVNAKHDKFSPSSFGNYTSTITTKPNAIPQDHRSPHHPMMSNPIPKFEQTMNNGANLNQQPLYYPPSSSQYYPRPHHPDVNVNKKPSQFNMFPSSSSNYRALYSKVSLEEEREMDRKNVERMLYGKSPATRFPPGIKHPSEIEQNTMRTMKSTSEPIQVYKVHNEQVGVIKTQSFIPPVSIDLTKSITEAIARPSEPPKVPYLTPPQREFVRNEENLVKLANVATKSYSHTMDTSNSNRGAEESTISKLKLNLELKEQRKMLCKNEVNENQDSMPAKNISPRQFRTKGELKGFVQNESINLLDWGNACHGFMEQLGTDKVTESRKRSSKSLKQNKGTSSDEDKPLLKLVKSENIESTPRTMREKQRHELEKKIAARLGHPSSSDSESENKKIVRSKRRVRKLRKRETIGMKRTDEEHTAEEIESDIILSNKNVKQSRLDNLTSSEEDENQEKNDSSHKKECQERKSSRSSLSSSMSSSKKKDINEKKSSSLTTPKSSSNKINESNDLKQLGITSELNNLINEGETMTRSKRKLEIEKKLSNSKVLRNDKVVRNDLCVKKIRKKIDSPKRKLDEDENKESVDKKKAKKSESDSSDDSENQKSDTDKKNERKVSTEKSKLPQTSTTSLFSPGWETETYNFKKSLKIPAGLITIPGKQSSNIHAAQSLPDLDHQLSDVSETFSELSKNCKKSFEQEKGRKSNSIIDLLHQRFVQSRKKLKSRRSDKNGSSSINDDDSGLLPTPEKESEKVFGFKKNIFETSILTSRTRNENSTMKKKEILREVFGADEDERPRSAPPSAGGNVDLEKEKVEKMSYDQKYREYLMKMDVDFTVKSRDENSQSIITEKDESEGENEKIINQLTMIKKKPRQRRLKGSSGFDYIRKKKKSTPSGIESQFNLSNIIKKRLQARENLENKDENDIGKEIKGWVLNKGVGESVLHKASRLNYMDVIAFCLERLNMNPDMKDNAGYTPLHEACSRGHLEVAQTLLLYGANHSETALSGIRPLHEAIENGHVEIVRLLISYGADPCLATYSGQLPIAMAEDDEMEEFLKEYLKDIDEKNGKPVHWIFDGIYTKSEDTFDDSYNVFNEPPCNMNEVESSIASVYSTSLTSLVTATTQLSDAETVMTESTASLVKEPIQDVIKYPHKMIKNDSNSNNLIMTDLSKQKTLVKHKKKKSFSTPPKQDQKMSSNAIKDESKVDDKFDCMDHVDSDDNDIFELEESEKPLPPVYLLKDEGSEKWVLLNDLCNLLKVKSKDAVLKQICPLSPSSTAKELIRELKMTDFLEKATCMQLFCAGEKLNVRASKISLIRYNDSVKNLLGVQTIRMNM